MFGGGKNRLCLTSCSKSKCQQDGDCAPWKHLPWWHVRAGAINCFIMRGNLLHFAVCRLVMYIERDSRKTTPGKEQQSGNEYLSKCLDLLTCHIVQELPRILGKLESRPQAPCCLPFCDLAFRHPFFFCSCRFFFFFQASAMTLFLECVVSKFECALSVFIIILYQ